MSKTLAPASPKRKQLAASGRSGRPVLDARQLIKAGRESETVPGRRFAGFRRRLLRTFVQDDERARVKTYEPTSRHGWDLGGKNLRTLHDFPRAEQLEANAADQRLLSGRQCSSRTRQQSAF